MPRPRIRRRLRFQARAHYFKPAGILLRDLEEVTLAKDELEALKLYNFDQKDQKSLKSLLDKNSVFVIIKNNASSNHYPAAYDVFFIFVSGCLKGRLDFAHLGLPKGSFFSI